MGPTKLTVTCSALPARPRNPGLPEEHHIVNAKGGTHLDRDYSLESFRVEIDINRCPISKTPCSKINSSLPCQLQHGATCRLPVAVDGESGLIYDHDQLLIVRTPPFSARQPADQRLWLRR